MNIYTYDVPLLIPFTKQLLHSINSDDTIIRSEQNKMEILKFLVKSVSLQVFRF